MNDPPTKMTTLNKNDRGGRFNPSLEIRDKIEAWEQKQCNKKTEKKLAKPTKSKDDGGQRPKNEEGFHIQGNVGGDNRIGDTDNRREAAKTHGRRPFDVRKTNSPPTRN